MGSTHQMTRCFAVANHFSITPVQTKSELSDPPNAEAVLQEVYFSSVALHSSLEQSLTGYFALDNGYSEMDNIDLKPACTNHATHKPVLHGQSLETSGSLLGIVFLH
jgi:hypothetical protein